MAFKDKDEFLDALYEHVFEGEEPDDDDHNWFETKVQSFFDKLDETGNQGQGSSRRRRGQQQGTGRTATPPRRKRREQQTSSASNGYGASGWWG